VTSPLLNLGVLFFGYHSLGLNGEYVTLTDRPDWAEHYVENKFYQHDPFIQHPQNYSSGTYLLSQINPPTNTNNQDSASNKISIKEGWRQKIAFDEAAILIDKTNADVEFFIFGGNSTHGDFNKLYGNHRNLLHAFVAHFKNALKEVIRSQSEEKNIISYPTSSGKGIHPLNKTKQQGFLSAIGHKDSCLKAASLTPAEKRCLTHLCKGQSIKGIAQSLMISPRTVETHLNSAKRKLNCLYKDDLVIKSNSLSQLGLLP
jgi:DNA-binding CsgD family transcriptional regulator